MKKKYIKRIIGIGLLAAVVGVFVWFMQITVTNRDDNDMRSLRSFYMEDRDSLDMVIMGSSEVMSGYCAAEAYRTAGYTSFPYAFSINSVRLWKYELQDIERTQHPKILFIETNGALYEGDEYIFSKFCTNALAESMPMSMNRIRLAYDLAEHPLERLFPIIKYHYKWKDIFKLPENSNLVLFREGSSRLKGVSSNLYQKEYSTELKYPPDDTTADLNSNAEEFLSEFLDVCKDSSIENIVFVEFPHVMGEKEMYERQQRANRAAEMIREAGFDYLDLTGKSDEIGLDLEKDFFDEHHLRASGQKKLTHYFADEIIPAYNIKPIAQSDKNRQRWDDSAELINKYYEFYDEYIKEHADKPHKKAKFILAENAETMKRIGN